MAIGDALRRSIAGRAQVQLAEQRAQEGLIDDLQRLTQMASRTREAEAVEGRRVAKETERVEFERFRGEFFEAQTAGTTTPEQLRFAAEKGLIRAEVPREPKPLTQVQTLAEELAIIDRAVLAGTATEQQEQRAIELRASRRVQKEDRPSNIDVFIGKQRFEAFEVQAKLGGGAEAIEEQDRIKRLPLDVSSFIAQLGFDNFNVGFKELTEALEQIIPQAQSDLERIELLIMGKNIVSNITRTGASPQSQLAALKIQEQTLANEIGAEAAALLIDFILKAQK